jgi:hypothetical protein
MIKRTIISLFTLLVITAKTQIRQNVDWITYYSDAATIENISTAVDGNQNVYTAGYVYVSSTNADLIVQARDSNGVLLWTYTYDNGGIDIAKAVRVTSNAVYVTGTSYGSTTGKDYVTIKLNLAGSNQWTARMNNFSNYDDEACDIKTDASGNVYVIGTAANSTNANTDIVTVKYNSSGTQQWINTYSGPLTSNDAGVALVLSGNDADVFITGSNNPTGSNSNIVTRSINASTGGTQWTVTHNGTASGNDKPYKIILSGANVVVCGEAVNTTTGIDYITIKYQGSNGTVKWSSVYDTNNNSNSATDLVRDSTGNICVTGYAYTGSVYKYHTVLYDSAGTQLFANIENTGLSTFSVTPKVVCDTIANHFYVCGEIQKATRDMFIYQIAPSGNTKWTEAIDGQSNNVDAATGMVINGIGQIYLSAYARNSSARYDITTIKISQTPAYVAVDDLGEAPSDGSTFMENKGQLMNENCVSVTDIQYYMPNTFPQFFFKNNEISMVFGRHDTVLSTNDTLQKVDMIFDRSNSLTRIYPDETVQAQNNYLIPQFTNMITDVKGYHRLMIPNIYPLIDLHYYSNSYGLKYYFVVKPGGNPLNIIHKFQGATSTTITGGGAQLNITSLVGSLNLEKPYVYQAVPIGTTSYSLIPVTGWSATWVNSGTNTYQFNVGTYTTSLPIVFEVDQGNPSGPSPATDNMAWNTYMGGNNFDRQIDMKVDAQGNIYSLSETSSQSWYITPNIQVGPVNQYKGAIVHKFNKDGILQSQVYIGATGSGVSPAGITVLSDSSVVFASAQCSTLNIIATNPANSYSIPTTNYSYDAMIVKFPTTLSSVSWITRYPYIILDIDANSSDDIYILSSGAKSSTAAPIYTKSQALNVNPSTIHGTYVNHLIRFNQNGVPNWGTHLQLLAGGFRNAYIKIDKQRNDYYIYGILNDTADFKHFNKYGTFLQSVKKSAQDGFIQKYSANDTILVSTVYGGDNDDDLFGADILSTGELCVAGSTKSNDKNSITFDPGTGSAWNQYHGSAPLYIRGWISKFDSVMHRTWAITYGDSVKDTHFYSVTRDKKDNVYIGGSSTGMSATNNFPGMYYQLGTIMNNAAFVMFDNTNFRLWATYHGAPALDQYGLRALQYNPVSDNLCYCGWAGTSYSSSYPYRKFPNAYWQNWNFNNSYDDGFIGRMILTDVVGIREISKDIKDINGIVLFPNPSTGEVSIKTEKKLSKPFEVVVYNSSGQAVYVETVKDVTPISHTITLKNLPAGIYFLNITSPEIYTTSKLIKE